MDINKEIPWVKFTSNTHVFFPQWLNGKQQQIYVQICAHCDPAVVRRRGGQIPRRRCSCQVREVAKKVIFLVAWIFLEKGFFEAIKNPPKTVYH